MPKLTDEWVKFEKLKLKASSGVASVYEQYELARMHISLKHYKDAAYWLQMASKNGFEPAKSMLSDVINNGMKRK